MVAIKLKSKKKVTFKDLKDLKGKKRLTPQESKGKAKLISRGLKGESKTTPENHKGKDRVTSEELKVTDETTSQELKEKDTRTPHDFKGKDKLTSQGLVWDPVFGSTIPQPLPWEQIQGGQDYAVELRHPVLTAESIATITGLIRADVNGRLDDVQTKGGLRFYYLDEDEQLVRHRPRDYPHYTRRIMIVMLATTAIKKIRNFLATYGFELALNEYDSITSRYIRKNNGRDYSLAGVWQLRRRSATDSVLTNMDVNALVKAIQKRNDENTKRETAAAAIGGSTDQSPRSSFKFTSEAILVSKCTAITAVTNRGDQLDASLPRVRVMKFGEDGDGKQKYMTKLGNRFPHLPHL